MLQKLQVFGIRHHGPGSSKRLLRALEAWAPDCLVIEAPADAEAAIKFMAYEELIPPVALLIYNPKKLQEASYFPFASFSPEWQAIQFAFRTQIPVRFMDLPMGMQYTLQQWQAEEKQLSFRTEGPTVEPALQKDPLGYIAKLAGYRDRERWWEATFEQVTDDQNVFATITELIRTLRNDSGRKESDENLRREAYMRKILRATLKQGYQKIAVVCGAWHAPALVDLTKYKTTSDNALLKGISKKKIKTTWIPWSYNRLAFSSGYGAGVLSPAWYDLLFHHREQAVTHWMIEVARLFREQDFNASSAHVLEAVRLADTLAAIRELSVPGQAEMEEAALAIFGEGDSSRLAFIYDQLTVGHKVGKVPPDIPSIPFLDDLLKQIKSCRLSKYWESTKVEYLKGTATNPRGGIDLREPKDLQKSHLLHRLNLLGIPWGTAQTGNVNATGSFKEIWRMEWQPEFSIRFIEVGIWGNTVRDAAIAFVGQEAGQSESLFEVATYIGEVLKADLIELIDPLIRRLQALAAMTQDVWFLMESLPALVDITQYGDARKTNVSAVYDLIDEIIPRVCIGLTTATIGIDEESSKELFQKLLSVNQRIGLLNNQQHIQQWNTALQQLTDNSKTVPLIRGISTRILFDQRAMDLQGTSNRLYYALSSSNHALEVANWLEGFLHGSGLVLIYHPSLWEMLDGWVDALHSDAFQEVLPVLRRTFATFPGPERSKMLVLAKEGVNQIAADEKREMVPERAELVWPTLQLLLGID